MLLEVENLQVYYGKSNILDGVCLQVGQGEIIALLGRNGAGKTTTLRTIMGLTNARNGSIRFSGTEISRMPARQRSLAGIGYVPQDKLLFSKMAVEENLKAAARKRRSAQEWEMVYELFPDLRERRKQKAGTLSGGQQQMLTIARALLTRPKLLLLDEPSTGLMPAIIKRIAEVIRLLNREGMSILIVEEQIPLAFELASRLYVMDVGRVVFSGQIESMDQNTLIRQYMGVR